jgi:hypothetical protein
MNRRLVKLKKTIELIKSITGMVDHPQRFMGARYLVDPTLEDARMLIISPQMAPEIFQWDRKVTVSSRQAAEMKKDHEWLIIYRNEELKVSVKMSTGDRIVDDAVNLHGELMEIARLNDQLRGGVEDEVESLSPSEDYGIAGINLFGGVADPLG